LAVQGEFVDAWKQDRPDWSVLAGLDPAIHAFPRRNEDVDARVKPAQDDVKCVRAIVE
jgi:hypothetical protein